MKKIITVLSFIVISNITNAQNALMGIGLNTKDELSMVVGVFLDNNDYVDMSMSANMDPSVTHMDGYYSVWPGDVWNGGYDEDHIQIGVNYGKVFGGDLRKIIVGGGLTYRQEKYLPIYKEEYVVYSPNGLYTIDAGNNIYESVYPSIFCVLNEDKFFLRIEGSIKTSNITIGLTL